MPDDDELSRYEVKADDDLAKYEKKEAAPKADQGTIGPKPSWSPGREVSDPLETIENYTQEGRKAHPILSRIGDATRNAKDMLRVVGPEVALLTMAPGEAAPAPTRLRSVAPAGEVKPLIRGANEVYQRPIEPAPGAGKGAAEVGMHPEELAEIRQESGKPEMTTESAHRFRLNKIASQAASTKPTNDLGGMKRAGEEHVDIDQLARDLAGVKPLKPDVPLREQLTPSTKVGEVTDPIKAKYPDPAVRQMVRANGERIYEATKGDPETVKAIHDLTRVELRQALINAGEDMGQMTVSNSKFAGEGSIPREEAFNRLLAKGLKPDDIVKLAKQTKPEARGEFMPSEIPVTPRRSNLAAQRTARERAQRIRQARQ